MRNEHIFAHVRPGDHAHVRLMDGIEYCGEVLATTESGLVIRPLASAYAESRVAIPTGAIIAVIVSNDPETRAKHARKQEREADLIDHERPESSDVAAAAPTDDTPTSPSSPPLGSALERFALPSLASLPASAPDAALGVGDIFVDETDIDPATGQPRVYMRALTLEEALAGEPSLADVAAVLQSAQRAMTLVDDERDMSDARDDRAAILDDAQAYLNGENLGDTQEGDAQEFYRRFVRATPVEQQVFEIFARWRSRHWALRPVD